MYSTVNMNLTSWNLETDFFTHEDMDANWQAIDAHDHSTGKGVQVNTAGIANSAITSNKLAALAVTNPAIAASAVATGNIQAQAITNALLAPGSVYGAVIPAAAIVASMLDPNIIPLGTVTLWYRVSGSSNTPGGGWEIMDGRAWSTISNTMGTGGSQVTTGNIPDMRGFFAMGADINASVAPGIGVSGGSNTVNLAHSHTNSAHTHTVPPHGHGISYDGNHFHTWQGGLSMWSRTNAFNVGTTFQGNDGNWHTNTYYSTYINGLASNPVWGAEYQVQAGIPGQQQQLENGPSDMDYNGLHDHGGSTEANSTLTSGASNSITDYQLGATNLEPANVAFLFIMRVR